MSKKREPFGLEGILAQLRALRSELLRTSLLASVAGNAVGVLVHLGLARERKVGFIVMALAISSLHLWLRWMTLDNTWKAALFVVTLTGESLFLGAQTAWTPGVTLIALAITVHGGLLLGHRAAFLIPICYGFALAAGGLLVSRGMLVVKVHDTLADPLAWLRNAVMFAGVTLVIAISLRRMTATLGSSRTATEHVLEQLTQQFGSAALARSSRLESEYIVQDAQRLRTLAQLSAGMTHLLKNTLTVVSDAIEQLKTATEPALVHDAMDGVIGAVQRAAATTRALLAFGRREKPRLEAANLEQQFGELRETLAESLPASIELREQLSATPNIFVEPVRLRQVILNLVLNSRDAIAGAGTVTVSTREVFLDRTSNHELLRELTPGHYVELCVEDNGMGMPPAVVERACEPFFTTKDVSAHDGLGLSVVLGLVNQWGGGLTIESCPDRGTRVSVYLTTQSPTDVGNAPHSESSTTAVRQPPVRSAQNDQSKPFGSSPIDSQQHPTATTDTQTGGWLWAGIEQALSLTLLTCIISLSLEVLSRGFQRPVLLGIVAFASLATLVAWRVQRLGQPKRLALATTAVALAAGFIILRQGYMSAGAFAALATAVLLMAVYGTLTGTGILLALCTFGVLIGALGPVAGSFDDSSVDPRQAHNWYRLAFQVPVVLFVSTATVSGLLEASTRAIERLEALLTRLVQATHVSERESASLAVAERIASQTPRLEAAGRLAGALAHDLNNALGGILGWAMLLREDPKPSQTDIVEAIAAFRESAAYAEALVVQLEPQGDAANSADRTTDVGRLIQRTGAVLQRTLKGAITLEMDLAADCYAPVSEHSLRRIVLNLASNASDAMPNGGTLGLHCRRAVETGEVVLEVRDSGIGMSSEDQLRVFDAFFTTKQSGRGTGLGLYTVAQLVEASGGTLSLDSAVGIGTRVIIRWLAVEGKIAQPQSQDTVPPSGRGVVLLAEDNVWVRRAMARGLERAGYQVVCAVDGTDAKVHLEKRDDWFALCTDAVMPGYASARLIEDFARLFPQATIVVCSGHLPSEVESIASGYRATFLPKPFSPAQLIAALQGTGPS